MIRETNFIFSHSNPKSWHSCTYNWHLPVTWSWARIQSILIPQILLPHESCTNSYLGFVPRKFGDRFLLHVTHPFPPNPNNVQNGRVDESKNRGSGGNRPGPDPAIRQGGGLVCSLQPPRGCTRMVPPLFGRIPALGMQGADSGGGRRAMGEAGRGRGLRWDPRAFCRKGQDG